MSAFRLTLALVAGGFTIAPASHAQEVRPDEVIAVERAALDRWGRGDPQGFLDTYAPEVTYFDPGQDGRVDGLDAMKQLIGPLAGKFKVDRYEMVNPKVQRHGEIAVLTYNIVNYRKLPDGSEKAASRWNSTAVFRLMGGRWRTIHSHWSFTKPELKQAPVQ
jgi:ketosteroid isomerase-like protein